MFSQEKYLRKQFGKLAANNFLSAFGLYLHRYLNLEQKDVVEAFVVVDNLLSEFGEAERIAMLENEVGIRLECK